MARTGQEKPRIVFFGTAEFAVPALAALVAADLSPLAVITQADKPSGRHMTLKPSPVKLWAEAHGLNVLQPVKLKDAIADITALRADVGIVVAYGKIIPANLIAAMPQGMLNIHPSKLPQYRGAAPLQYTLWHGDRESAITFMLIDAGMDTGPILKQIPLSVQADERLPEYAARAAAVAAEALPDVLQTYLAGKISPVAQPHTGVSVTAMIEKTHGRIDWKKTALEIYNQYRAFYPWPGIWCLDRDQHIYRLLEIRVSTDNELVLGQLQWRERKLMVGTAQGVLEIISIQPEGKKPQSAQEFVNGHQSLIAQGFI